MAWTHFYCSGTLDESVILEIFIASLRAVGCAATLASAGLWLARRGLMSPSLSKGLSQLSVQLAIPALLFSSVIPSISFELLSYAWPLFLLPALYLFLGAIVGHVVLLLVRPPHDFRLGTVAACTFGNTTGIPIVLLSVLQQSLSHSVFADIADPLLFLSLELVSFPLLQARTRRDAQPHLWPHRVRPRAHRAFEADGAAASPCALTLMRRPPRKSARARAPGCACV